jgi:hypothetical protein
VGEFARFENLDGFSGDENTTNHVNLGANTGFDNVGQMTYRLPSKMNDRGFGDDTDLDLEFKDESPF